MATTTPTRHAAALALALLAAAHAPARAHQPEPPTPAPEARPVAQTQVSRALRERLDCAMAVLNGDAPRFWETPFTEQFAELTPPERLLAELRAHHERAGGFRLIERRILDPRTIGAWIESVTNHRERWIVRIAVRPERPFPVESFEMTPARTPDLADTERLFEELDRFLAAWQRPASFAAFELAPDGSLDLVHELDADRPLAAGTAGMIWAQLALAELVRDGGADWEQPLAIDDTLRALPESRTLRLPAGADLPLREHARRMLTESDATAAEHLAAFLGRQRVTRARAALLALEPADADPFISVGEYNRLKCSVTDVLDRYARADAAERLRILDEDLPSIAVDPTLYRAWWKPQELRRVGWIASAADLCAAAARLAVLAREERNAWALAAMLRPRDDGNERTVWKRIWSAAGGEPGAAAGLWVLERHDGRVFVMALILNDEARPIPDGVTPPMLSRAFEALANAP